MVSGPSIIQKQGHIKLPVDDTASIGFGLQEHFIIGYQNSPDFYYYKYKSGSFKLIWQKTIPESHIYACFKYISQGGEIFLQSHYDKVYLYDQELRHIRTLPAPGVMFGLLHGGPYAVVPNRASPGVPIKLSVVSSSDLDNTHHHLDVPPEGAYDWGRSLFACGHEESGVAVIARNQTFVDLYNPAGELY